MQSVKDLEQVIFFYILIKLQNELRLHQPSLRFTIHLYDSLALETGIMDTEWLISLVVACEINFKMSPLPFSYVV